MIQLPPSQNSGAPLRQRIRWRPRTVDRMLERVCSRSPDELHVTDATRPEAKLGIFNFSPNPGKSGPLLRNTTRRDEKCERSARRSRFTKERTDHQPTPEHR